MNRKMRNYVSVIWGMLILLYPAIIGAETITVSGDVYGTWSADTVIVMGELRVPPSLSLTIEPGVEVYFWTYGKLIVDSAATLTAIGTPGDSILFNESWDWPNNGWHGIRFLSASSSSRLQYCHLKNGYAWGTGSDANGGAVYCSNSSPMIRYCLIDSCEATGLGGAIYCNPNSNPTISSNTINGNEAWDYGGAIYCGSYTSPVISGNSISGNTGWDYGGGIYCGSFSYPVISDNAISLNEASQYGGGIYCGSNSNPSIVGNVLNGNISAGGGGGVYCGTFSDPTITDNTLSGNDAGNGGGIYCASNSTVSIDGNVLSQNSSIDGGGIYCSLYSFPTISNNTISGNIAVDGGAIYCDDNSVPAISSNTIRANVATDDGGGVFLHGSSPSTFELNEISLNSASDNGGGVFMIYSNPVMNKNTISGDTAASGGGICSMSSNPDLVNCIVWDNIPQSVYQTLGSNLQATYSDIDYYTTWPGTGNINDNPLFVYPTMGDYRLQWGSPCIDAGDPNAVYNDPDGTRADMGCHYYDQSIPVRILLTPYNDPIEITTGGGAFIYFIQITNNSFVPLNIRVWVDVTLPQGSIFGPVLGPLNLNNFLPGSTAGQERSQNVPAGAPPGIYTYNAYAAAGTDTSYDSFTFIKLESDGSDWLAGWFNTGEPFFADDNSAGNESTIPENCVLSGAYPNPFNPATTISFHLPDAALTSLSVYDVQGRLVATLVDGWRDAGTHEVTFDGSNLASGVYITRMEAEGFSAIQKMVLVK